MKDGIGIWTKVEIFARHCGFIHGWDGNKRISYFSADPQEFRPIRTPEQIAAEAREAKAKALYCAINWDDGESGWSRLLEARKDDYRKAVDEGWTMVPSA